MVVIGIDPGLSHTGWGVIEILEKTDNISSIRLKYISHGVISSKSDMCISKRILRIKTLLYEAMFKYQPRLACIEEVFVNIKNPISALKLGAARGAAILAVAESNIAFHECSATMIKKVVGGHGHTKKDMISTIVREKLSLPDEVKLTKDASDALAVAIELSCRAM